MAALAFIEAVEAAEAPSISPVPQQVEKTLMGPTQLWTISWNTVLESDLAFIPIHGRPIIQNRISDITELAGHAGELGLVGLFVPDDPYVDGYWHNIVAGYGDLVQPDPLLRPYADTINGKAAVGFNGNNRLDWLELNNLDVPKDGSLTGERL